MTYCDFFTLACSNHSTTVLFYFIFFLYFSPTVYQRTPRTLVFVDSEYSVIVFSFFFPFNGETLRPPAKIRRFFYPIPKAEIGLSVASMVRAYSELKILTKKQQNKELNLSCRLNFFFYNIYNNFYILLTIFLSSKLQFAVSEVKNGYLALLTCSRARFCPPFEQPRSQGFSLEGRRDGKRPWHRLVT